MLIYKISSPNMPKTVYAGSTKQTGKARWSKHTSTSNGCMSKGIIAAGGASMVVLETVTDTSVNLVDREFFYIMKFKEKGLIVLNDRMPGAIARAGGVSAYGKKYRADNPERTRAYNAINNKKNLLPLMCDCCGRMSSKMAMKRHQRTKRCKSASQVQPPTTIVNNITAHTVYIYNK